MTSVYTEIMEGSDHTGNIHFPLIGQSPYKNNRNCYVVQTLSGM